MERTYWKQIPVKDLTNEWIWLRIKTTTKYFSSPIIRFSIYVEGKPNISSSYQTNNNEFMKIPYNMSILQQSENYLRQIQPDRAKTFSAWAQQA